MPFVLDASVALAWSFRDEQNTYAHGILRHLRDDIALVPGIWPLEVSNGLLMVERRERFTTGDVSQMRDALLDLPIEMTDLSPERALGPILDLARSQGLSAYDAAYLELAMRQGIPLATQDEDLRTAAGRVGVRLAE